MQDLGPTMRRALEALDALAGQVQGDRPSETVRLAEAVSTARGALYAALVGQGWIPPSGVPEGVELDTRLLDEGLGGAYDSPLNH